MNERSFSEIAAETSISPRGERTRASILDAAYRLFLAQGYHGTSMRQVAGAAGVSPAVIYNYFSHKEELFRELLAARIPLRPLVAALAQASGDSAEALARDALLCLQAVMADQLDNLRLMFIELLEFQGKHAEAISAELAPTMITFVDRLSRSAGGLGRFQPILVGRAFLGLFISYAITAAFFAHAPGLSVTTEDLQALGDLFLNGVLQARSDDASHSPGPDGILT